MKTVFFIIQLLTAFALNSPGQDAKPGSQPPAPEMKMRAWLFPNIFQNEKHRDMFYVESGIFERIPIDVPYFFRKNGIEFPAGSEGKYFDNTLVVRSDEKTLAAVDAYVKAHGFKTVGLPSIEFSAVECVLPPEISSLSSHRITYPEFQKLPSKSLKLLDRVSATGRFGEWAVASHVTDPAPADGNNQNAKNAGDFGPGESGTIISFNATQEADGSPVSVNATYRFRKLANAPGDSTAMDVNFNTYFTSADDNPVILNVSAISDSGGKFIVIIGKLHIVHPIPENQKSDTTGGKSNQLPPP